MVETHDKSPRKLRHPGHSASLRVHGKSFGICPEDDDAPNSASWTLETSVTRADSKSPCRDVRGSLQDVSASRELLLQASHEQLSARIEDLQGQVESTTRSFNPRTPSLIVSWRCLPNGTQKGRAARPWEPERPCRSEALSCEIVTPLFLLFLVCAKENPIRNSAESDHPQCQTRLNLQRHPSHLLPVYSWRWEGWR